MAGSRKSQSGFSFLIFFTLCIYFVVYVKRVLCVQKDVSNSLCAVVQRMMRRVIEIIKFVRTVDSLIRGVTK